MPHLILETSANIVETNDKIKQALIAAQNLLVEKLPTSIERCRSRLIIHDVFVLGNNNIDNASVHLTVKVLKGRTPELLTNIATLLKELLQGHFHKSNSALNLIISVEVLELGDFYA